MSSVVFTACCCVPLALYGKKKNQINLFLSWAIVLKCLAIFTQHSEFAITNLLLLVCVCVCCSWTAALLRAASADGPWRQTHQSFPHQPQPQLPADLGKPNSWSMSEVVFLCLLHSLVLRMNKKKQPVFCCWCAGEHSAVWVAPCSPAAPGLERFHEPSFPRRSAGLCFWQLVDWLRIYWRTDQYDMRF